MKYLFVIIGLLMISDEKVLFDFASDSNLSNWTIVDDVVMGGRSDGNFIINDIGNGLFYGRVSTENYGGFSSVRYYPGQLDVSGYTKAEIRLKGDGKDYQFRTKNSNYDRHSYVYSFATSGEWETIEIPFQEMEPRFRGMYLNMPNYPGENLQEIAFLIGNKRNESFELEIDWIVLKK